MKNVASEIIIDDVLLYGYITDQLLAYFRTYLYVLKHYHAKLNINT